MNRIILIGNGFDLAHKLKTSYNHFIDNYWQNVINNIQTRNKSDNTIGSQLINMYEPEKEFYSENDDISFSISHGTQEDYHNPIVFRAHTSYKNNFLKTISENQSLKNWVDIEEEYYQQIKNILYNKSYYTDTENKTAIEKLNDDFKIIKDKLKIYLNGINETLTDYTSNFPKKDIIERIYSNPEEIDKILFLNFNYTLLSKIFTEYLQIKFLCVIK